VRASPVAPSKAVPVQRQKPDPSVRFLRDTLLSDTLIWKRLLGSP
jgi:hypothetical protein